MHKLKANEHWETEELFRESPLQSCDAYLIQQYREPSVDPTKSASERLRLFWGKKCI